jgi:pimeloyl-ACP methyl ester carboxylesterase
MGAPIVLLYAARHPGHASGLIVQSGFARWDHARLVEGFRSAAGDAVADMAARGYAGEPTTEDEDAQVFAAFGRYVPDDAQRARTPRNADLNPHGMDLIRKCDILDQLGRIDVRALVCTGELDPVTPVGAAEEVAAALPEGLARLEIIPNAGHFTWLDAPDRYWPPIIDFLNRL